MALRIQLASGPRRLGPLLGHVVLTRHGLHGLAWLDRPTGQLIRRYERARPGELVRVDIKKIGWLPRMNKPRGRTADGQPSSPSYPRATDR